MVAIDSPHVRCELISTRAKVLYCMAGWLLSDVFTDLGDMFDKT